MEFIVNPFNLCVIVVAVVIFYILFSTIVHFISSFCLESWHQQRISKEIRLTSFMIFKKVLFSSKRFEFIIIVLFTPLLLVIYLLYCVYSFLVSPVASTKK